MLHHCLRKEELSRFIELHFELPEEQFDCDIEALFGEWQIWGVELSCISTSLSQVLERRQKSGADVFNILNEIFCLSDNVGLFAVEFIDLRFVRHMLNTVRDPEIEIEDNLAEIRSQLNEFPF